MIIHTNAFKTLKDQSQEILDFAILVSYAAPFLRHKLKEAEESHPGGDFNQAPVGFRPETFDGRKVVVGKIRDSVKKYKGEVAKTTRLSTFSYFESYVGDVLKEVVAFHNAAALSRSTELTTDFTKLTPTQSKALRKLKEPVDKEKLAQYHKAFRGLEGSGVILPHYSFVRIGMERMEGRASSYRASDIPGLLTETLGFQMTVDEQNKLTAIREARNRIAHGKADPRDLILPKALDANERLRALALRIDQHVLSYWMLVDPVSLPFTAM